MEERCDFPIIRGATSSSVILPKSANPIKKYIPVMNDEKVFYITRLKT